VSQLFAFALAAAIRATLLLLGATGIAALLRKRPAAMQHAIWTAAMAASLAIPVLSATLSSLSIRSPVSVSVPVPALLPAVAKSVRGTSPLFDIGAIFSSSRPAVSSGSRGKESLLVVWLVGLVLGLSRILRSGFAVRRLRRSAMRISDVRITSIWRELQRRSHSGKVLLVEADGITAPGTAGIVLPTIFLPSGAAEWGSIRIRATLAHELAHIARHDCLTQLLGDIVVAIYWFNPLVWYARRRLTTERERACDDLVLRDGVRPERYASMLVETVRTSLVQRNVAAIGVLSMARPSELEMRLVSILNPGRSRGPMSLRATIVTASLVTAAAVLLSASHLDAAIATATVISASHVAVTTTAPAVISTSHIDATVIGVPTRSGAITAKPAERLQSTPQSGKEPDLRGDSIASPLSERVALSGETWSAARNTAGLHGPDSVLAQQLFAQLSRSPSWEGDLVRDRSAWALSRQRDGRLIGPLIESLADQDWRIRAYAAWALALSGARQAVPALVALLSDPNWRMRAMAAYALDGIGDESVAPAMARAIDDEAWQVRVTAVHFIGSLENAKYEPLLEAAQSDRHIAVRQAASAALGKPTSHR
jgi:beta-lactamase regulating signal transducer with metallopeptidase domain